MEQEMIRRLLAREEAGMADLLLHYGPTSSRLFCRTPRIGRIASPR